MKTLESIQKTCKVFKTLAKIAMILSFVWAGITLVGLLCGIAWRTGGHVYGISMENALKLAQAAGLKQMIGTPFTLAGAEQIKSLGIKTIVMPLVAAIISAVIYECFGLAHPGDRGNGTAVVLGIALILFSLVLRHGAELREGKVREKGRK